MGGSNGQLIYLEQGCRSAEKRTEANRGGTLKGYDGY